MVYTFSSASRVTRPPSDLMISQKDSQNSENLLYLQMWFITQKGYRLKLEKRCMQWSPGEARCKRPAVLSQCSCLDSTNLPSVMCDNKCEELPTREAHLGRGFHGFYWGSVMQAWNTLMADLSYSVTTLLSPAEVILTQRDSGENNVVPGEQKQFTINHMLA